MEKNNLKLFKDLLTRWLDELIKHADDTVEGMYRSWVTSSESGLSPGYRELFMQQEAAIREAMQGDRSNRHSDSERGWTPPPRGYAEDIADSNAEKN